MVLELYKKAQHGNREMRILKVNEPGKKAAASSHLVDLLRDAYELEFRDLKQKRNAMIA
jgi:hypothetical protein